METVSTVDELIGVLLFMLLVATLVRPCIEVERYLARRKAGVTRHDVKTGRAAYRRQRSTGTLTVRVHPSRRAVNA